MKRKSQTTRLILLASILLLGVMPMKSDNLYVYKTDGAKQTVSLDELRKLTFTDTNLAINKQDGTTTLVALTSLRCFSLFDNLYIETSTNNVLMTSETANAVSVYMKADMAIVKSNQNIIGVNVFDLQGRKLLQFHSASQEVSVPLSYYPSGIYLIQVACENGITTKKIIKN